MSEEEDEESYPDLTPEGATYYNPRTDTTWVYHDHHWEKQ